MDIRKFKEEKTLSVCYKPRKKCLSFCMYFMKESGFRGGNYLNFSFSKTQKALYISTCSDSIQDYSYILRGWGNAGFIYDAGLAHAILVYFGLDVSNPTGYIFSNIKFIRRKGQLVAKITVEEDSE